MTRRFARLRALLVLPALLLLAGAAFAAEVEEENAAKPRVFTDEEAKTAISRFDAQYKREDFDLPILKTMHQVDTVKELSKVDHKLVTKKLSSLLRVKEDKLFIAAADGLGKQKANAPMAANALQRRFDPSKKPHERTAHVVRSLGILGHKKMAKDFVKLFAHEDDQVTVEAIRALGNLGDPSILPKLREFYEINSMDPSKGVNVRVDTGTAGSGDMNRARAAGRRIEKMRRKNRKDVNHVIHETLEKLCGKKISTPDELKEWMTKNKKIWR